MPISTQDETSTYEKIYKFWGEGGGGGKKGI